MSDNYIIALNHDFYNVGFWRNLLNVVEYKFYFSSGTDK